MKLNDALVLVHYSTVKAVDKSMIEIQKKKDLIKEWFSNGGKYEQDFALSDIFSALSDGEFNDFLYAGHSKEYWNANTMNRYVEVFANITTIDIIGNNSKELFSDILNDLYSAYKEIVKWES